MWYGERSLFSCGSAPQIGQKVRKRTRTGSGHRGASNRSYLTNWRAEEALIDVSSRGNWPAQKIPIFLGYRVRNLPVVYPQEKGRYGYKLISVFRPLSIASFCRGDPEGTSGYSRGAPWERSWHVRPQQANDVLAEGKADIVLFAHEYLHDPQFVLRVANEPSCRHEAGGAV